MNMVRKGSKRVSKDNWKIEFKADASMAGSTLLVYRHARETRQELPRQYSSNKASSCRVSSEEESMPTSSGSRWDGKWKSKEIDFDGLEAGGRGRPTLSWVVRGLGRSEESVDVKESSARRGELDCLLSSAVTVKTEGKEPRRSF